ncbi:MAG: SDR family oxidoreductase [Acidimicrobiia bacterium]|nr:SDR family oxidoreductase [Acidimicrobiia bacterium]
MTALAGRIALITGGASGLGRLMALRMASRGATVVAWDLDEEALAALVDDIERTGGRAHGEVVNVADADAVADAALRVHADVGAPTVLVNNAGVVSGRPLLELADADIRRTFEVNALALYWTTRAFLPGMIERNSGHLVTVASAAGLVGVARQSDYSASKHAAVGFDESLRVELRRSAPGVRTTVVCPYYIDTGMFDGVRTRFRWLLPILDPDDVADRIVAAVERNRAQVILPPAVRLLAPLRVLPPRAFDRVMDLLGVNVSMEHFVGRR